MTLSDIVMGRLLLTFNRVQTSLENLDKIAFFEKLRENLENSWNFREFFKIPGKLRENLTL